MRKERTLKRIKKVVSTHKKATIFLSVFAVIILCLFQANSQYPVLDTRVSGAENTFNNLVDNSTLDVTPELYPAPPLENMTITVIA